MGESEAEAEDVAILDHPSSNNVNRPAKPRIHLLPKIVIYILFTRLAHQMTGKESLSVYLRLIYIIYWIGHCCRDMSGLVPPVLDQTHKCA